MSKISEKALLLCYSPNIIPECEDLFKEDNTEFYIGLSLDGNQSFIPTMLFGEFNYAKANNYYQLFCSVRIDYSSKKEINTATQMISKINSTVLQIFVLNHETFYVGLGMILDINNNILFGCFKYINYQYDEVINHINFSNTIFIHPSIYLREEKDKLRKEILNSVIPFYINQNLDINVVVNDLSKIIITPTKMKCITEGVTINKKLSEETDKIFNLI